MFHKALYEIRPASPMRVAGFMSGSGSNLRKIIEHGIEIRNKKMGYDVVVIFSDNPQSNAEKIGNDFKIPVVINDIVEFYRQKGKPLKDLDVRREYDQKTVELLKPFNVDVIAYAGYMRIVAAPLMNAFLGINVHPADLSIVENGKRKYTGDNAVRDAILAGEKVIRATTHVVEPAVDGGRKLMISEGVDIVLPEGFDPKNKELVKKVAAEHQNKLKERGDWVIFPKTLEYLADGRYSVDRYRGYKLFFDRNPIPDGVRL